MKQRNTARRTTRSKRSNRSNRSRRPRKAIRKRYTGGDSNVVQTTANQRDYESPPTTSPPSGEGWNFILVVPTERTLFRMGAGMEYEYVLRDDGRFDVYSRIREEPRENNNRRT